MKIRIFFSLTHLGHQRQYIDRRKEWCNISIYSLLGKVKKMASFVVNYLWRMSEKLIGHTLRYYRKWGTICQHNSDASEDAKKRKYDNAPKSFIDNRSLNCCFILFISSSRDDARIMSSTQNRIITIFSP